MKKRIKAFLKDEGGYMIQALIGALILGLGAAAVAFGILSSNRNQGGDISSDIKAIEVPGEAPEAGESLSPGTSDKTGAAINLGGSDD